MEIIKPLCHAERILTDRQFEIFDLLGRGKSPTEVGELLFISRKTVSSHRVTIMERMGFKNTYELIHYAVKHEYIKPEEEP